MSAHPAGPKSAAAGAEPRSAVHPAIAESADVWPRHVGRTADGVLAIAGVSARELVNQYGSPLFILDEADVRMRARAYRHAYASCDIYYAAKAFLSVEFARWVHEEGLGIDVCTLGELRTALAAGIPGNDLLMHGNNKSDEELKAAIAANAAFIVVDSLSEIERLQQHARAARAHINVLVRVTVGVEAHTHEFIATAHEDQKFGFSLASGGASAAVLAVNAAENLEFAGLHSHIGSQIFDEQGFLVAVRRLLGLCRELRDEHHILVSTLNLGGGAGIAYLPGDDPMDIASLAVRVQSAVADECSRLSYPQPRLAIEPGRSVCGPAGITVYTVGTVKPVTVSASEQRLYVSVDGGMSDNIRTALYDASYTVAHASRTATIDAPAVTARVVGKHCESGDIVVRDALLLADVQPGELLAVAATGAYCRAMASNYNSVPRPAVVAVRDGRSSLLLRRETLDDVLALDVAMSTRQSAQELRAADASQMGEHQ